MNDKTELEAMIQNWLDEIKPVPPRSPKVAAQGRARFLARAVSASEFQRHKGWISIFRKEHFAMNMVMSILVIAGLLFGGGATVNAAQNDLPNDPLYGVKIWSEDVSLQFQGPLEAKVDRLMELTQIRVQEITQLIDSGQTPPDQVRVRLEQHMQQAFELCSNMDDTALDQKLLQLRDLLRRQKRDMERLQIRASQNAQPILERTRTMLQTRLQLVEEGLRNHEMFRNTVRNGFHYRQTQTPPTSRPSITSTPNGPRHNGSATPQFNGPGNENGPGPNPNPGGPNPGRTPVQNHNENGPTNPGSGGNGSGGNQEGSGSGGNEPGGNGSGGENGNGGENSGGNGSGGNGP